jgi:hypothetical protein
MHNTIRKSACQRLREHGFEVELRRAANTKLAVYLLKDGKRVAKAVCGKPGNRTMELMRMRAENGFFNQNSSLKQLLEEWAMDPYAVVARGLAEDVK